MIRIRLYMVIQMLFLSSIVFGQSFDERYIINIKPVQVGELKLKTWIVDINPDKYFYDPATPIENQKLAIKSAKQANLVKRLIRDSNEFVLKSYNNRNMEYAEGTSESDLMGDVFDRKSDPWQSKAHESHLKSEDDYLQRRSRIVLVKNPADADSIVGSVKWVLSDESRMFVQFSNKYESLNSYLNGVDAFEDLDLETKELVEAWEKSEVYKAVKKGAELIEIENYVINRDYNQLDIPRVLLGNLGFEKNDLSKGYISIHSLDNSTPIYALIGFKQFFSSFGFNFSALSVRKFSENIRLYLEGILPDHKIPGKYERAVRLLLLDRKKKNRSFKSSQFSNQCRNFFSSL